MVRMDKLAATDDRPLVIASASCPSHIAYERCCSLVHSARLFLPQYWLAYVKPEQWMHAPLSRYDRFLWIPALQRRCAALLSHPPIAIYMALDLTRARATVYTGKCATGFNTVDNKQRRVR